jgi:hypothetical protein
MKLFPHLSTRGWLALLVGFCLFYFYSGGGPNQGTRLDLTRALLEHGRVSIDEYHQNTIDKAPFKGHYYCDKAPASSFTALPAVALAKLGLWIAKQSPDSPVGVRVQGLAATWLVATLPVLFTCLLVFAWSRRQGFSPPAAVFAAVALGLASPLWAYGTVFWGHALATFCLFAGAYAIQVLLAERTAPTARRTAALAGLLLGWAVITEFPTAPPVFGLTLYLVWKLRPLRTAGVLLTVFATSAAACAVLLMAYNTAAFGSPFHLGYASVQGFDGMQQGIFGVTYPKGRAMYGILVGPRGLLATGPLLLLGIVGHVLTLRHPARRGLAQLGLAMTLYFIYLNGSYHYWHGGWTYGPRHLSAALPFLALGLPPLVDALGTRYRFLLLPLLATAFVVTVIGISVHGMTPETIHRPLTEYFWPNFRKGQFALCDGYLDSGGPGTNLGIALGLPVRWSLLPFWIGVLYLQAGLLLSLRQPPPPRVE